MIFFYDAQGRLVDSVPQNVYQGSNKASRIWFIMPTSAINVVNVAFTLPNGKYAKQRIMTKATTDTDLPEYKDETGQAINVWYYDLLTDVTSFAGKTTAQFFATTPEQEIISTQSANITVLKGTPPINMPAPENEYQLIINALANISTIANDALSKASQIEAINEEILQKYQKKIDEALETESKEIVGAINEVNKKASQGGGTPTDVQINGVSITENGVANIPFGYGKLGVVAVNGASDGIGMNSSNGRIFIYPATEADLRAKRDERRPIVPKIIDKAVISGVTANVNTLTDEEKESAQEWLGVKLYQHEVHFRVGADYPKAYLRVNFITRSAVALTKNEIWQHLTNTDYTKGAMGYVMVTKDDNTLVYCPILYTLYAPVDVNIAYLLPDGTMGNIYCYESDIDYDPQWDDKVISI